MDRETMKVMAHGQYVVETNEVIDWPWYMGNFMNSSLGLTYIYLGEI